nr:unnamed protein product [Digitaria exilis]
MPRRRRRRRRWHLRRRDAEVKNRPRRDALLVVAGESPQVDELAVPHQAPRPIVESRWQAAAHAMSLWAPATSTEPFGSCTVLGIARNPSLGHCSSVRLAHPAAVFPSVHSRWERGAKAEEGHSQAGLVVLLHTPKGPHEP